MSEQEQGPKRGGKRGKHTRERILHVAEQLIAVRGVDGFELKDVAAGVGIRAPSIFAHFKGREDLAEAVARRVGRVVLEQFRAEGAAPEAMLGSAVRSMVGHLAQHPAHVRILLADLGRHREGGELSGSAEQVGDALVKVEQLLERGTAAGVFRPVRPDLFMAHMLGAVLGALAWYGWDDEGRLQGPIAVEDVVREIEWLALSYLRPLESASEG